MILSASIDGSWRERKHSRWPEVYGFHFGGFHNPKCQGTGFGFAQCHYGNMETGLAGDGFIAGTRQQYYAEHEARSGRGSGIGSYAISKTDGSGSINWPSDKPLSIWFENYMRAKNQGVPECIIDLEMVEDPTLGRYEKDAPHPR